MPGLDAVLFGTVDYPEGDRGGNEICIRKKEENKPINLHQFWDDIVIRTDNFTSIKNRATSLIDQFPRDELAEFHNGARFDLIGACYVEVFRAVGIGRKMSPVTVIFPSKYPARPSRLVLRACNAAWSFS